MEVRRVVLRGPGWDRVVVVGLGRGRGAARAAPHLGHFALQKGAVRLQGVLPDVHGRPQLLAARQEVAEHARRLGMWCVLCILCVWKGTYVWCGGIYALIIIIVP